MYILLVEVVVVVVVVVDVVVDGIGQLIFRALFCK